MVNVSSSLAGSPALPPVPPPQPAAPPVAAPPVAAPVPIAEAPRIEIDLGAFIEDGPGLAAASTQGAAISANQLNFDRLSGAIIQEIKKVQRLDRPTEMVQIQVGGATIEVDPVKLTVDVLKQALEKHFSSLSSPEHLRTVGQLQAQSRSLVLQIRQGPAAPAALPAAVAQAALATAPKPGQPSPDRQISYLAKEIETKLPAKIRAAYGLNAAALKTWAESGQPPAGLQKLCQDYGKGHQEYFQPILLALAYGKAVVAKQQQAGKLAPAQATEQIKGLDALKSEAAKKWESLNAGAVGDSRKVADSSFSAWEKADKAVQKLSQDKSPAGRAALAKAQAEAAAALQKHQKAQKLALETAHAMKEVRVHRVEISGGPDAPVAMREKAAHAILDAAATGVQAGKHETKTQKLDVRVAEQVPGHIASSQQLLEEAEQMLPEWQGNQGLIDRRTNLLEAQQEVLKPFMSGMDANKRLEDERAKIIESLAALPPEADLPEQVSKREALRDRLADIDATRGGANLPPDPAGSSTRPAEVWLLHMHAKSVAKLQKTYAADVRLNTVPKPTEAQLLHVRAVSDKSKALHLETAHYGADGLDAQVAQEHLYEEAAQWKLFGRQDALDRVEAARQKLLGLPETPAAHRDGQKAQYENDLIAALAHLRSEDARLAKADKTPSGRLAALRARELGEALEIDPVLLASRSEDAAAAAHARSGRTYKPNDPAWQTNNGNFIRDRSQLNKRSLERAASQANLAQLRDQGSQRLYSGQADRLQAVNAALRELPPAGKGTPAERAQRKQLEAEKSELKGKMGAYEASTAGSQGLEAADAYQRLALTDGPKAQLEARRAEHRDNVQTALGRIEGVKAPRNPAEQAAWDAAIEAGLSAAETPCDNCPGEAAGYLSRSNALVAALPEGPARDKLEAAVKKRAVALYKAYAEGGHESAFGDSVALRAAVEAAVNPRGVKPGPIDEVQQDWAKWQAKGDPTKLFAAHRAELGKALEFLQTQVAGDIEAQFDLAVAHGGFAVGTAARIARSQMKDGDIAGAKATLAKAINQALAEADKAEADYKALPAGKQDQYRAILRSSAPPAQKQEALEQVFGYRVGDETVKGPDRARLDQGNRAAEAGAGLALRVADSTQTMQRAHAGGSDYDFDRNAEATAAQLADRTTGLRPKGGAEAEALASRHAYRRQRDEKYWNDPVIAVMTTLVDEAAMFALTLGASGALSLAKNAFTGLRGVKAAYEASRVGKFVMRGSEWAAKGTGFVRTNLARIDGLLMSGGRGAQLLGLGFRAGRSMGRNILIEQGMQGVGYVAQKLGGKDSLLAWAADAGGRMFSMNVGEIKGLDMLQNSLWNVGENLSSQLLLPALYKDPKDLAAAQEAFHYLMMGLQTVHGMQAMRADAKLVGEMQGAGMAHDYKKATGTELDPKTQAALSSELSKYQEALRHNQDVADPRHLDALAAGLERIGAAMDPAGRASLKASAEAYLAPLRQEQAARRSGADRFDGKQADAKSVKKAVEALGAELLKMKVTTDPVEAARMAAGQIGAQVLTSRSLGDFEWTRSTPESQAQLRTHLETTAAHLQSLGLAADPVQAMALAKADLGQRLRTAFAEVVPGTPAAKAFEAHYAQLERVASAWQHANAVVGKDGSPAARQAIQDALMAAGDTPLQARLEDGLQKALAGAADAPAKAKELAQATCRNWAEEVLVREQAGGAYPDARPRDWHDRHIGLLKALGVEPKAAAAIALESHLGKLAGDYADLGQTPAQQAGIATSVHETFARLRETPPSTPVEHDLACERVRFGLEAMGIKPAAAELISRNLVAEAAGMVRHLDGPPRKAPPPVVPAKGPVAAPTAATLKDPAHMLAYYQQIGGWDKIRRLEGQLPPEVFKQLNKVRDELVKAAWAEVVASAKELGLELHPPYVGRGPDAPGYTGVAADIDLVLRIKNGEGQGVANLARKEMLLKQLLQQKLNAIMPSPGHQLDVNAYVTPHLTPIGLPGQTVPPQLIAEHQHNELQMDFYQIRMGYGEHGDKAWDAFKQQALTQARAVDARAQREGQPATAVRQLEAGFKAAGASFAAYQREVLASVNRLVQDPAMLRLPYESVQDMARELVRAGKEAEVMAFLRSEQAQHLEAPSEAGAAARVQYQKLQMELRAFSPEAYAGNAAVIWGSRKGAEQQAFLGGLAADNYAGLQGRVSQAQYILHYAVEAAHLPVEQRAWKAGKYDLRDALFLDAVMAKGTLTHEVPNPVHAWAERMRAKDPNFKAEGEPFAPTIQVPVHETRIIEMRDNSAHYERVKENKAHDPDKPETGPAQLPMHPDDDPRLEVEHNDISKRKQVPANKMDQAALDARVNAKSAREALGIWKKYYGSETDARAAMKDYLSMLAATAEDTSARHLMSPPRAVDASAGPAPAPKPPAPPAGPAAPSGAAGAVPPAPPKPPVKPPAVDGSAGAAPRPKPVPMSSAQLRERFIKDKWEATAQPGVYRKPDGGLVSVALERPAAASPAVKAHIDAQIAHWQAVAGKGSPAENARVQAIIDSLATLRDSDALSIELSHSSNSMMLDGLAATGGRMLSAKRLKEEHIVRKTGEGDTFSGASGDKTDIFFGYGEEGLGTSMAYFRLAGETEHYNLALMPEAGLKSEIARVEKILAHFDELPDILSSPMIPGGQDKAKVEARLRSLKDEQIRRASLPPELLARQQPYPIMFSVKGDELSIHQLPNRHGGLTGEATIADSVDLGQNLRAVFVPAAKVVEVQARLREIFGPECKVPVLAFEALDIAIQNPEMAKTGKPYDETYDGMVAQQANARSWYDYAARSVP